MREELKEYLYQTNRSLLSSFKWGSEGEGSFNKFMRLVREELVPKDVIPLTKDEAEKIKDNIERELNIGNKKEEFKIICPKCQGENVSIGRTIYDETVIRCENKECKFKEFS